MLTPTFDTFRLFLHVLSAAIWVGGQITMAGLVPALRGHEGIPKVAARAFSRVAWPAFFIAVFTGLWNVFEVDMAAAERPYHLTLGVKVLLVVAIGLSAWFHGITTDRRILAATGALSALGSIVVLFLGILLRSPL